MNLNSQQVSDIKRYISSESYLYSSIKKEIFSQTEKSELIKLVNHSYHFKYGKQYLPKPPHDKNDDKNFDQIEKSLIIDRLEQKLSEYKNLLKESVCIKFDYCRKIRAGEISNDEFDMAIAIADSILSFATGFPLPATMISAYLIKNKLLVNYCDCN